MTSVPIRLKISDPFEIVFESCRKHLRKSSKYMLISRINSEKFQRVRQWSDNLSGTLSGAAMDILLQSASLSSNTSTTNVAKSGRTCNVTQAARHRSRKAEAKQTTSHTRCNEITLQRLHAVAAMASMPGRQCNSKVSSEEIQSSNPTPNPRWKLGASMNNRLGRWIDARKVRPTKAWSSRWTIVSLGELQADKPPMETAALLANVDSSPRGGDSKYCGAGNVIRNSERSYLFR
ncbi:hypothetical protein K0M31_002460, partial [Melipona bicolor]